MCQSRIFYPAKLYFRYEREINAFPDEIKNNVQHHWTYPTRNVERSSLS